MKDKKINPKILIFDIENTPNLAAVWQLKTEYVPESMVEYPWYMLCWSGKWLGEKKVYSSALINFPKSYKKDRENDKFILQELWKLLDEADIVIGHNVVGFDIRKSNARFIMNGMTPPSPYKVIDTLKVARYNFMFTSNKLNDLAKYLGIGSKVETGGYELWKQCMKGNKKAWQTMVKYCKHDVVLTEKVYLKLRPYIQNHPSLNVYNQIDESQQCPKCQSNNIIKEGFMYTNVCKYQRYSCKDCGGWSRSRKAIKK